MNYNNYNSPAPGGFAVGNQYAPPQQNNYQQNNYQGGSYGDSGESLDFDLDCVDPNAEPWQIAQQLSGGNARDIGSSQDMQRAFSQAQNMNVNIDEATSRSMFEQTNVTSRGGGGTSFSTKLIAGAAGWAAMSYYQSYQKKQGQKVNHAFLKKMVAGIAMAQAVKMFNKQNAGGNMMGMGGKREIETSREAVAAEAAANAMKLVDQSAPQDSQYGNQYNAPPQNQHSGYGQQGGYNAPPQQYDSYNNQPGYAPPNFQQGNYGAPAPPAGGAFGMQQGNYSAPPQGPPMGGFPGAPQSGYGVPPPYGGNPGPGGFIDPSQRKY